MSVSYFLSLYLKISNYNDSLRSQVARWLSVAGFSPEIFEGVVAFSRVVKLGSITNVTQSAT